MKYRWHLTATHMTRQGLRSVVIVLTCFLLFSVTTAVGQDVATEAPPAETEAAAEVPEGINDRFKDPELNVDEWVERFEMESREVFGARKRVLEVCEISPGDRVADIGAGTGFYSRLFANAVGSTGWVYAVDIAPRFLQHIAKQSTKEYLENITMVLGTDTSVRLPPESVDLVFTCDTYHHFEVPQQTLASIYRALKPGGRFVLIDFERIPGKSRDFILGHVRAGKEVFKGEVLDAGFKFIDEIDVDGFEENYLLRFEKPNGAES